MKNVKNRLCIFGIFIWLLMLYPNIAARAEVCPEGEHQFVVTLMHKAGEEESGERRYICMLCGYTYTEEIEPTGHQWGAWIVDKVPTENEAGHRYRYCYKYTHSTHYQEEVLPPLSESEDVKMELLSYSQKEGAGVLRGDNISIERERYGAGAKKTSPLEFDPFFNQSKDMTYTEGNSEAFSFSKMEEKTPYTEGLLSIANKERNFLGSLLVGRFNGIDLASGIVATGIILWYIVVLSPMCAVLGWIEKKKLEAISGMKNQ